MDTRSTRQLEEKAAKQAAEYMPRQAKIRRVCLFNPQGYVQDPPFPGRTDTGGQTTYVLSLAKALGRQGILVDIVTRLFDDYPPDETIAKNVRIVRIPAGPSTFVEKERLYELMPELADRFLKHVKKHKLHYGVVHSHYWDGGYGGIFISRLLHIPHVHTPHTLGKMKKIDMSPESAAPQNLNALYNYHVRIAIENRIYSTVDAIVVLCETSRIQMLQHYLLDFEKLHVIYSGINEKLFNPQSSPEDKKIQFQPNAIMTASRLVPAKGLDLVLDALHLLKGNVPFHYYLAGGSFTKQGSSEEEATKKDILSRIKNYHLEKNITLVGSIEHEKMPSYFRACTLFVLASRYEPFGLTTMEAMACGKPTIVSHMAGSREVVVDGLNGFIVDTQNTKEFADRIATVLTHRQLQKKIGENAALTIQDNYTWDKVVQKFIELYKSL